MKNWLHVFIAFSLVFIVAGAIVGFGNLVTALGLGATATAVWYFKFRNKPEKQTERSLVSRVFDRGKIKK